MSNFREYNTKLVSLRNMRRITQTLKMISALKYRRMQEAQRRLGPYAEGVNRAARLVCGLAEARSHAYLTARSPVRSVVLVVMTSDRGLCGGFNHGILTLARERVADYRAKGVVAIWRMWGRRGHDVLRRDPDGPREHVSSSQTGYAQAAELGRTLREAFLRGEADEVYLVCNEPGSAGSLKPGMRRWLPMTPDVSWGAGGGEELWRYDLEPGMPDLAETMLEKLLDLGLFRTILDNAVGEHFARLRAMEVATQNIDSLSEYYELTRNRVRQAAITRELMEVMAGAESLRMQG